MRSGSMLPLESELKGHTDSVDQLAWHPSHADVLGTASGDKTVRVWDARAGKCSYVVETSGQNINIAWSPDGQYIVTGNKKDVVSVIDTRKYKVISEKKFDAMVNELAFSRDGEYLLITTGMGSVKVLSFPSFKPETQFTAHSSTALCLDFDPTGRYLATGGADALVALWDLEEMVAVRSFDRLDSQVRTVSFSHDGAFLACGSEDMRIDISDVATGEHIHNIEVRAATNSIAWNPRCHLLAYANDDAHGRPVGAVNVFGLAS